MAQRTSARRRATGDPGPGPSSATPSGSGGPSPAAVELTGDSRTTDDTTSFARLARTVGMRAVLVLVVVILAGVLAAQELAEREALEDAATTADVLAEAAVQPALTEGVATSDPAALLLFDRSMRSWLDDSNLVRANLWRDDGTIVWSDEPRLLGRAYELGDDRLAALSTSTTRASVADLSSRVNRFERDRGDLLQVYRPVRTPQGTRLLFEIYPTYDAVDARAAELTRGFSAITISALLVFVVLLLPLLRRLTSGLQQAQQSRERLLEDALDASAEERRRIAGDLHDGVVQELAATSFALSGAAARTAESDPRLKGELDTAARTLRSSIAGLRSLLVDIYPRSLEHSGLAVALDDLAGTLRSRGLRVHMRLSEQVSLDPVEERLVFRVARECLHNVRRHAQASEVTIVLRPLEGAGTELRISDDGVGFDLEEVRQRPEHGHVGLQVMADVAGRHGARLLVSTAPGDGCTWILEVPS